MVEADARGLLHYEMPECVGWMSENGLILKDTYPY